VKGFHVGKSPKPTSKTALAHVSAPRAPGLLKRVLGSSLSAPKQHSDDHAQALQVRLICALRKCRLGWDLLFCSCWLVTSCTTSPST
jgi:hypothetical protein